MADEEIERWVRLLGTERVRAPQGFETSCARIILEPANSDEIGEIVRRCETDQVALAALGSCRTLRFMRPAPLALGLSMARMARIVAYEPDDMTVTVEGGLSLAALNAHLAPRNQHLPLDPAEPQNCTIGALIAASHAGPLRLSAGTARDYLIGIRFVGNGGRSIHSGGRVVKNVAGYDFMKLMTGSFGTLGAITEATFKIVPQPESYGLAIVAGSGIAELAQIGFDLADRLPLLHLDLLSPGLEFPQARRNACLLVAGVGGNRPELDYQLHQIAAAAPGAELCEGDAARSLYRSLRDLALPDAPVRIQISTLPRELPRCLELSGLRFRAQLGSGVAQIAPSEAGADQVKPVIAELRRRAAHGNGHARLLAIDRSIVGEMPFFDSPNPGALGLMRRIKGNFDPAGIFNPGGFVGGT